MICSVNNCVCVATYGCTGSACSDRIENRNLSRTLCIREFSLREISSDLLMSFSIQMLRDIARIGMDVLFYLPDA